MENKALNAVNKAVNLGLLDKGFVLFTPEDVQKKPYLDCVDLILAPFCASCAVKTVNYLLQYYPADTKAVLYNDKIIVVTTLQQLDMAQIDPQCECFAFVSGSLSFDKTRYTFGDLIRIIERLTAEDGCPWDKAQTHASIRSNMLEEAGEAAAAIDSGDLTNLSEELGDVLLQPVLHADIARRSGEFTVGDVISGLCGKLYRRHTHIFGSDKAVSAEEALVFWQKAKEKEKEGQNTL